MGSQFAVVRRPGRPSVLAVCGEVDIATASALRESLCDAADLAAAKPGTMVTVDLSGVTFIDARGMSVLVVAEAYAHVRGVRMVFTGVSPAIARLLRISGLTLSIQDADQA